MIDFGKWAFANKKLVYFLLAVLLAGGALVVGEVVVVEHEHRHLRAEIEVAVLVDGGDPREVVFDERLHVGGERCHSARSFRLVMVTLVIPHISLLQTPVAS